jgi:hypothetical protein
MKKLILLGLIAVGVSVGTTAKAGGFSINIALPRPPFFLPPPPPIFVPAPVGLVGCAPGVVVAPDCYWDARARCYVPRERYVGRGFDRDRYRDYGRDRDRDRHFSHDRR